MSETTRPGPSPQVHFGPPTARDWSHECAAEYQEARKQIRKLVGRANSGSNAEEAVEALIALGSSICYQLEALWGDEKHQDRRPLLSRAAKKTNWLPLHITNLTRPDGKEQRCDEMRDALKLAPVPGREKGKKGRRPVFSANTSEGRLNLEIEHFVIGVKRPGWHRYVDAAGLEQDVVDRRTRKCLLSTDGRKPERWTEVFISKLIRELRPELLSVDSGYTGCFGNPSGLFGKMVNRRLQQLGPDVKDPWSAFRSLVNEHMAKYKSLIETSEE